MSSGAEYHVYEEKNLLVSVDNKNVLHTYRLDSGEKLDYKEKIVNIDLKGEGTEFYETNDSIFLVNKKPYSIINIDSKTGTISEKIKISLPFAKMDFGLYVFVIDGLYYVTYQDNQKSMNGISCIDVSNNKELWQKTIPTTYFINPVNIDDSLILMDESGIFKVSKTTGIEEWRYKVKNPKALKINGNFIYAALGYGETKELSESAGYKGLVKISAIDGSEVYKFETDTPISAINRGKEAVFFTDYNFIYKFDIESGVYSKINFKAEQKSEAICGSFYLDDLNVIFLMTEKGYYKYNLTTNTVETFQTINKKFFMYEFKRIGSVIFLNIAEKPTFTFASTFVYAIDLSTGKIMWEKHTGFNMRESSSFIYDYSIGEFETGGANVHPFKILPGDNIYANAKTFDSQKEAFKFIFSNKKVISLLLKMPVESGYVYTGLEGYTIKSGINSIIEDENFVYALQVGFDTKSDDPRGIIKGQIASAASNQEWGTMSQLIIQLKKVHRFLFGFFNDKNFNIE